MNMRVGPVVQCAIIRKYKQRLDKAFVDHGQLKTKTPTLGHLVQFVDCLEKEIESCSSSKKHV
jgi:flagellar biosynthesis chaperone FliJ